MDDLGKHGTEPTQDQEIGKTPPNPPHQLIVSFKDGKFTYDNGTGKVEVLRRFGKPEVFPIHFERKSGENWIFTDWTWAPKAGAPGETPGQKPVLELIDIADDRIKVRDRVVYEGPHSYSYTITAQEKNGPEKETDPEIENRREPGR